MKFLKILFTLILVYSIFGVSNAYASTITPAINEIQLAQGQRMLTSLTFGNKEDRDIQILITVYGYDPQTEELSKDSNDLFLKADTDTFTVKANSQMEIPYEIFPISNQEQGTYFNLIVLSPVQGDKDIYINKGISQLVILHVIDQEGEVKGIATQDYITKIEVVNKGIPFITPLELKYTITNNSNFVLTPTGRIDIFNKRGNYKPEYIYINSKKEKLYPRDTMEKIVKVSNWHLSDIFVERMATGNFSNGLDTNPKLVEVTIGSYTYEIMGGLIVIVGVLILIKSLKEDIKKKN